MKYCRSLKTTWRNSSHMQSSTAYFLFFCSTYFLLNVSVAWTPRCRWFWIFLFILQPFFIDFKTFLALKSTIKIFPKSFFIKKVLTVCSVMFELKQNYNYENLSDIPWMTFSVISYSCYCFCICRKTLQNSAFYRVFKSIHCPVKFVICYIFWDWNILLFPLTTFINGGYFSILLTVFKFFWQASFGLKHSFEFFSHRRGQTGKFEYRQKNSKRAAIYESGLYWRLCNG